MNKKKSPSKLLSPSAGAWIPSLSPKKAINKIKENSSSFFHAYEFHETKTKPNDFSKSEFKDKQKFCSYQYLSLQSNVDQSLRTAICKLNLLWTVFYLLFSFVSYIVQRQLLGVTSVVLFFFSAEQKKN